MIKQPATKDKTIDRVVKKYNDQIKNNLAKNCDISSVMTNYTLEFLSYFIEPEEQSLVYALCHNFQRLHDEFKLLHEKMQNDSSDMLINRNAINQIKLFDKDFLDSINDYQKTKK